MTKVAQSLEALKTELPALCSEHLHVGVFLLMAKGALTAPAARRS